MTKPLRSAFSNSTIESPQDPGTENLGWDQSDAYILKTLSELPGESISAKTLGIVNDQFGALAKSLKAYKTLHFNDSAVASLWIQKNLGSHSPVQPIESLESTHCDILLIKLPKNITFFRYILYLANKSNCSHLIISGLQRYWSSGFYKACYHYYGQVDVSPGIKKAKLAQLSKIINVPSANWVSEQHINDIQLINYPNVFAWDKIDIGSRFFLQHFPTISTEKHIIDLGCGNGILGISALKQNPKLHLTFIDESHLAIHSCRDSLKANNISKDRYTVIHDDGTRNTKTDLADMILCNPPFHDKHHITSRIAQEMIKQASNKLDTKGRLILIGNRHLHYRKVLFRYFDRVNILASNSKFIIYDAFNSASEIPQKKIEPVISGISGEKHE